MSPNAGPSKRSMMFRMMLLSARQLLRRSVGMRHLDTPPTPSAQSGPRRSATSPRRMSRSTLQLLDVPRNQESFVLQQVVDSSKELRSVMTKPKLLFKIPPRRNVPWSLKEHVVMSLSWSQSFLPKKNVLMFQRRFAPDQE